MYNKRMIGTNYEQLAVQYLCDLGYVIVERNFRCRTGEIDIIAKDANYLVFIEVKYRNDARKGLPAEAINMNKMRKITRTAQYFIHKNNISVSTPCRFDVVNILKDDISLIKNAFDATT